MPIVLVFVEPQSGRPRAIHVDRSLRVGRAVGPHGLRLDDPSVAATHADIELREGGNVEIRLVDPEGALFVNGTLLDSAALEPGDLLHVGNVAIRVVAAGPAVAAQRVSPEAEAETAGPPGGPFRHLRLSPTAVLVLVGTVALVAVGWPAVSFLRHQLSQTDQRAGEIERVRLEIAKLQAAQKADRKKLGERDPVPTPTPAPAAAVPPTPFPTFYFPPTPIPGTSPTDVPPTPTPTAAANPERSLDRALSSIVVVTGRHRSGATLVGSGFFVASGYVVTNAHVVDGGEDLTVRLPDGPRLRAFPVKVSRDLDLAVLRVTRGTAPDGLPYGDSASLRVGQPVYAVGSPLGEELSFSVTRGIVSAPRRVIEGRSFVQHDAPINPGNSGGPLLDADGRIVGVITFKVNGAQGLGFAIPVEDVVGFLREGGYE